MKKENIFFGIIALLILVIYGQSLFGGFVFDDRGIKEHEALLSSVDNVLQVAAHPYWTVEAGLYRPTTLLSYLFNITLLGGSAFSFHFINLLLYFGVCAAIYILIKRLFEDKKLALLSTFIFLVLPIHTEVVANITGRSELMALFFSLLTLWEFTRERTSWWRPGLWLLLGLGAKETAIAAVPLAALLIFIMEKGVNREIWERYKKLILSLVGGAVIYFLLRYIVLGPAHFIDIETSIIENPLLFVTPLDRVTTAFSILWMYVSKTFWPANLCSDYSYNQIPVSTFSSLGTLLGIGIFFGSVVAFFIYLRHRPVISFASAIFLTSFIPVSNILYPIGTIAGERLFFFPSLGFALLLAYILRQRRHLIYLAITLIAVYGFIAFRRQSVWMSEEKLFLNAVQCSPNSVLSLSNAGTVYYFRGDYDEAQKNLEKSREIKPVYSKGLNNLGLVYWKQGKNREAEQMYFEALKQRYPYPGAYENLVLLYLSQGDYESAERWLRVIHPNSGNQIKESLKKYQ